MAKYKDHQRNIAISFYVNKTELDEIQKKFNLQNEDMSKIGTRRKLAVMLRDLVFDSEVNSTVIDPIAIEQWQKLARLSANIQQIAKHLNAEKSVGIQQIKTELAKVRNLLIGIKQ